MADRLSTGLKRSREVDVVSWRDLVEKVRERGVPCRFDGVSGAADFPAELLSSVASTSRRSRVLYNSPPGQLPHILPVPMGFQSGSMRMAANVDAQVDDFTIPGPEMNSDVGRAVMGQLLEDTATFLRDVLTEAANGWLYRQDVPRRAGSQLQQAPMVSSPLEEVPGEGDWDADFSASPDGEDEHDRGVVSASFKTNLSRLLPNLPAPTTLPPHSGGSRSAVVVHSSGKLELTRVDLNAALSLVGLPP